MILGIDGNNWIHKLWHAQNGVGVLPAVAARIDFLAERIQPSAVVVCLDSPASFRRELFPSYKSGRKEKDGSLVRDLAEAPEAFSRVATVAIHDGFEADDCLASLAACACRCGDKIVLASGDKDLRQCLQAGTVTILREFSTAARSRDRLAWHKACDWYTAARLMAECELLPDQWASYQALRGDPGDGVPGCPGFGETWSMKVIRQAGSLMGCFDRIWSLGLTERLKNALLAFQPQARLMLDLVTLRTDVAAAMEAVR